MTVGGDRSPGRHTLAPAHLLVPVLSLGGPVHHFNLQSFSILFYYICTFFFICTFLIAPVGAARWSCPIHLPNYQ